MTQLQGRVALVTGAGSGIGRAVAVHLAGLGAQVVVADINEASAKVTTESILDAGGTAATHAADVSIEGDVAAMIERAVEQYGRLDILHNNAAILAPDHISRDGDIATMDVDVWDRTMAVNLRGTMLGCKHAVPVMLANGGGSIINSASVAALLGDVMYAAYGVSKAAIVALTKYVATAYGKRGVRCNAILPGLVPHGDAQKILDLHPELSQIQLDNHVTPYLGTTDDICEVVAFLASDASRFITGHGLVIDGGWSAHQPQWAQMTAAAAAASA